MQAAVVTVLALASLATPAFPARALSATDLGVPSFEDMVVDGERSHVFVSGQNKVFELGYDGALVAKLTNVPGAAGLEIQGDVLYVASAGSASIYRFDLTRQPPRPLTPFGTAPYASPRDLVYAGGRLWFAAGTCLGSSQIVPVTLTGNVGPALQPDPGSSWSYCAQIDASPQAPNILFAWSERISPATLSEYDVSPGQPPAAVRSQWDFGGGPLDVMPGGGEFLMGEQDGFATYRMSDYFGPVFRYSSTCPYSRGPVDVTPAGGGRVLGGCPGSLEPELWAYRIGEADPYFTWDFPDGENAELWNDGLRWSPDGTLIFAVTGAYHSKVVFRVVDTTDVPTSVSLEAADASVRWNRATTLTARLEGPVPLEGSRVAVYRIPYGETASLLAEGPVDASGTFTVDTGPLEKHTRFVARYAGTDDSFPSDSEAVLVRVRSVTSGGMYGYDVIRNGVYIYTYDPNCSAEHPEACPTFGVRVSPNHAGYEVEVYGETRTSAGWEPGFDAYHQLSATSRASVAIMGTRPGHTYRVAAAFRGDPDHDGSASRWRVFRVERSSTASGASAGADGPLRAVTLPG